MSPKYPIALDYIFHGNAESQEDYKMTLHKNELKVKFKNAVMQVWTKIKQENTPKDMTSLIQEMIERREQK